MTGSVTILTGPSGAGKSTVAARVAASLDLSVHLHTDDFWGFIAAGGVLPYLPESDAQNHVVLRAIAAAAFAYADGCYDVIADGVVGPWMLDHYRHAAAQHPSVALRYVVLRPSLDVTLERALARPGPDALVEPEVVEDLWHKFSDLDDLESHVIDTTDLDVDETVGLVRTALTASGYALR